MHQNGAYGFKFDFSKNLRGGAHQAPYLDPSLRFFSGLPSVWASPSILGHFAPSTRASPSILECFAPSIRASPLTFDWGPWFAPPPHINSWIRQCSGLAFPVFPEGEKYDLLQDSSRPVSPARQAREPDPTQCTRVQYNCFNFLSERSSDLDQGLYSSNRRKVSIRLG